MKRTLTTLFLALMTALALSVGGQAGPYRVEITSDPVVLPVGKSTLLIDVTDAGGKPLDGLQVRAIAQMPNMAMGEREQVAIPAGTRGRYRMAQSFSMAGAYEARIAISGPLGEGKVEIPLETGKSTATTANGSTNLLAYWPWLLVLAPIAYTISRMRKTGQGINPKGALSGQVVSALVVLAVVVAGAIYAVKNLRRPGSMTPLEANTMEMDMPPPEGVLPVTLATAERTTSGATLRYSGQAVGFVEQAVVARTTGVIVWMPAYLGSKVRKGEVIARLDTSQLAPQVAQQRAMVDSARAGVDVARSEFRQSQSEVHLAESERGQFQGAVDEAEAMLTAAQEEYQAALAEQAASKSEVRNAQAQADAATAGQRYWDDELKREAALFSAGAVSKEEFDKEKADAARSAAELRQAQAQVQSATAKARSADAMVRKANAGIRAAERRVAQAKAALMSHHAHVSTAEAGVASAQQKIAQSAAGVRQAQAELNGVTAQAGYAEIRAETDGVVTERVLTPGTLAAPGQTLLRIAQVSPLRLQANVPEADLARIQVGAPVQVHVGKNQAVAAKVTSISPAVDPTSRTGIVEAVLPNLDQKFLPGQLITLEIQSGEVEAALTVPSEAVQSETATGDDIQAVATTSYVWVATDIPGQVGRYSVARKIVEIGERHGDRTVILNGLNEGDRVVVTGAAGITEGQTVAAETNEEVAIIRVTEGGLVPSELKLTSKGRKVTFLRTTDNTCAKEVVFESLKITRDLPLNKPVTIELPESAHGSIRYACGMDMIRGAVIVP